MGATLTRPPSAACHSVRVTCEHLFVDNPNHKGNIAELEIATAAAKLGLSVSKPIAEHERYDLVIEIGGRLQRVQCKWGRVDADRSVIDVRVSSSRWTPAVQS